MREERLIPVRMANTTHFAGGIEITDPVRIRPAKLSRRDWRELMRKGRKQIKKQELARRRAEAAVPESEKIDRRLHEAGLYSSRDMGRVRPVKLDRVLEINLTGS